MHGYKADDSNPALIRAARLAEEGQLYKSDGMPKSQLQQFANAFKEVWGLTWAERETSVVTELMVVRLGTGCSERRPSCSSCEAGSAARLVNQLRTDIEDCLEAGLKKA